MVWDDPGMLERQDKFDSEHYYAWDCFLRYVPCRNDYSAETLFECFEASYIRTYMTWELARRELLWARESDDPSTVTVWTDQWPDRPDLALEQVAEQHLANCFRIVTAGGHWVVYYSDTHMSK